MSNRMNGLEHACESFKKVGDCFRKLSDFFRELKESFILDCCPNKKVVHLAKHSKKKRIRKKNMARAYKMILNDNRKTNMSYYEKEY